MTRRRFMADLVDGNRAALLGSHAAHLSRVLRVRPGQQFDIAVNGAVRLGAVTRVEDERVEFELGDEIAAAPILPITLFLSIVRFERLEWALEKCVELGAARVVPLIAARTDPHLAAAAPKRTERWQRLLRQAAEQARRSAPPQLASPVRLRREELCVPGLRIVLAETARTDLLRHVLQPAPRENGPSFPSLSLAVGPEGGWTEAELKLFADCGWTPASLGPNILRTETAALAALAIAMSLAG
jgi:16S rRNA (uracil1498-N3)-methyltransferase